MTVTLTVSKITAFPIRGPSSDRISVTKIVAYPIIDSNSLAAPTATVKKRVSVRGRIFYP